MRVVGQRILATIAILLAILAGTARADEGVSVQSAVDQEEVSVGQPFTLQVQVDGSDAPGEPDTSPLTDFTVESKGGQQNSSESVSIVNGHMSRVSRHGYVFTYSLTPKREGALVIPPLAVNIDNQVYRTQPVSIVVRKPQESEDFKLRLRLAKDTAYVGEPVPLTVTWYIGKDVNGFSYNLPILTDPRFVLSEGDTTAARPNQTEAIAIPVPGGEIVATKGHGVLDGVNYLTVSFTRTLIAKVPGRLTLPQATVSCQALSGYRHPNSRDPFSGFFPDPNDFFGGSRKVYQTVVVPSDQPVLEVLPLPEKGRPADFSGLVGQYSLAVSASPTTVKVGDPITLTIQIAGPAVSGATLPDLAGQLGGNDFKVPEEMAPGEGSTVLKTFTQTIRARHAGVKQIPGLHLSYFNPASGNYETASAQPIPLQVAEARMVTAQDAEGGAAAGPAKREIETAKGGISYNYEGPEVLESQAPVGSAGAAGLWVWLLALPPGLFAAAATGIVILRSRRRDPAGRAAKQAHGRLREALAGVGGQGGMSPAAGYQALGHAVREYLGAKLRRNPAALTYADVEPEIVRLGAGGELSRRLREVMEQCEAGQYAGGATQFGVDRLRALALQVADELEPFFNRGGGR